MLYRVTAAQASAAGGHKITLPRAAKGILVHAGCPSARIYFDTSTEQWLGESSTEAITGLCLRREFSKVHVRAASGAELPDIVFEALDCEPATVANVGREFVVFRREFLALDVPETNPTPSRTLLISAASSATLAPKDVREQPTAGFYIGGAIVTSSTFTLRLWSRISATKRALLGALEVTSADPDGLFSATLDAGWRKMSSTLGPLHQMPVPMTLPWELELFQPTGAGLTVDGIVYVRRT